MATVISNREVAIARIAQHVKGVIAMCEAIGYPTRLVIDIKPIGRSEPGRYSVAATVGRTDLAVTMGADAHGVPYCTVPGSASARSASHRSSWSGVRASACFGRRRRGD